MTPAIGCFLASGIALIALMLIVRGGGFLVTPSPSVAVTASAPATFPELDVTERMVALEEYKAMVETEGYQAPKEIIAKNYKRGLWTIAMVDMAVTKGSIDLAEKAAIIEPVVVEPIIKEITK